MMAHTIDPGVRRPATAIECFAVTDPAMVAEHHRIRRDVFVAEQQLFIGDDRDLVDDDPSTIKVLSSHRGQYGGTVRLFALDEAAGHWQGDRLAVLPEFRMHGLGGPLVRYAVQTAANLGGRVMTAHIQVSNVKFFERLGWHRDGLQETYVGVPHVPMAIELSPFVA